MPVFPWAKKKNAEGEETFELPEEITTQLKAGVEAKEKLGKMEFMLEELKNIQVAEKTAREKKEADAAAEAARKKASERQTQTDAEIEELMLTDPKEAIRRATEGQTVAIMNLRADNIKRDVFEDAQKFKYYTGDIKREVDALIAGQNLNARNDPSVVENCYHTVMGKHADEIAEGKIKNRFAGSESSSRGTSSGSAGSSGAGGTEKKTYDTEYMKEIERAAKQVGIKTSDYIEMLEKDGVL
jgi:hypothetical protein